MKKYIAPSMKVVNIQNEAILAGSFGSVKNAQGYSESGYQGGYARGRHSVFSEEEEEQVSTEWSL